MFFRFLILIMLIVSSGQSVIAQGIVHEVETWNSDDPETPLTPSKITRFEYDSSGKLSAQRFGKWVDSLGAFVDLRCHNWSYNEHGQLFTIDYVSLATPAPFRYYMEKHDYVEDKISRYTTTSYSSDGDIWRKEVYHYNIQNTQVDSADIYWEQEDSITCKTYYQYTPNRELRLTYRLNSDGSLGHLHDSIDIRYNDQGLRIKFYQRFTDAGPDLFTYDYDEDGRLKEKRIYHPAALFPLSIDHIEQHTYTEGNNGKLKQKISRSVYPNNFPITVFFDTLNYEYYCDDHLKTITKSDYHREKQYFSYTFPPDCTEDIVENPKLFCYPNPAEDQVFIESTLLLSEHSVLQLFDLQGRLVKTISIPQRLQFYRLGLDDLTPNIYILLLVSDKQEEVAKLIKN